MILRRWGTLVQCRVTWPQVAILRIYICSDDRTKMWWRWLCVCVRVCVPTCVYLCGFNLPRPRFPRVSVTYCFYEAASSSALLFFFLEIYFMSGASSCCIFHSEDRFFSNEVWRWRMFRGGVRWKSLKGRIRNSSPMPYLTLSRQTSRLRKGNRFLTSFDSPADALFYTLWCGDSSLGCVSFWGFCFSAE